MIDPVIDANELARLGERAILADVRWYLDGRSGRDAYLAGHLPGAIFVDLDEVLAGPSAPARGRHPLPEPEEFAADLATLGVDEDGTVVAYDDAGGVIATRLVWMLRAIGQDAALLDGGLLAYEGPLETGIVLLPPATRVARPWPGELLATIEDAIDPDNVVIDARPPERYRGEGETHDPRAGHIPGARSLPCREHVDERGRLLGREGAARARLEAVGAAGTRPVVSYCGSGVTACHNLLVLEYAGLPAGRLFPGSWSQYAADATRQVATGPARD